VEEEQCGLGGDRQAHLIAHGESAGAFEVFLVDEHAGVAEELVLVGGGRREKVGTLVSMMRRQWPAKGSARKRSRLRDFRTGAWAKSNTLGFRFGRS
jgi:hypothetical protein